MHHLRVMLMISRRIGERIVIGDSVEVTITEIHRRTVRLAIKSSPGNLVLRGEVRDAIESANKAAALAPLDTGEIEALAGIEASSLHPAQGSFEISPIGALREITNLDDIADQDAPASVPPTPAEPPISHSKQ